MEEDREPKHVCKFCGKSFPCGRSLGGHMRSHVINNSTQTDEELEVKKLSSLNNGYCLRDNPKKTWRAADISVEVLLQDKSCRECGKGFLSWKALYGHMKCHSEKERVANNLEEHQDSWTDDNTNQKLVVDRQSDNELSAPNRRKRSERRTRCTATATSAFSLADPAASSVSDGKHEQEEVAMSLIMLSRDVGSWGALNSVTESSGNDSMHLQARTNLFNQIKHKEASSEIATPKEQEDKKGEIRNSGFVEKQRRIHSESSASEFSKTVSKVKRKRVSVKGFFDRLKSSHADSQYHQPEEGEHGLGNKLINEKQSAKFKLSGKGYTSVKRKFIDMSDSKVRKSNPLKQVATKVSEGESCSKRSKFECTTCNKVFSSYQALGGHRASHRRTVACTVSRTESSEKSTETDLSPEQTDDSKVIESNKKECLINREDPVCSFDHEGDTISRGFKKIKGHECPICFKVFTSGQALGGHKRSHLIVNGGSRNCETLIIPKPVSEIRDFLDLNLPAPAEEDSNSQVSSYSPPWLVSTSSALS